MVSYTSLSLSLSLSLPPSSQLTLSLFLSLSLSLFLSLSLSLSLFLHNSLSLSLSVSFSLPLFLSPHVLLLTLAALPRPGLTFGRINRMQLYIFAILGQGLFRYVQQLKIHTYVICIGARRVPANYYCIYWNPSIHCFPISRLVSV
jgi:hypothetical protein